MPSFVLLPPKKLLQAASCRWQALCNLQLATYNLPKDYLKYSEDLSSDHAIAQLNQPGWRDPVFHVFASRRDGLHSQLTCVGGYAPVYIAQEVAGNQFTIAGGAPGLKVSWQISALRDDPYLRDNRVEAETDKTGDEIGRYWYPAGYGQPVEQSLLGDQGKGGLPDAPPMEMKEVKP